jgi:2-oxoglutarate ferredoxin oxidoreductase subunit beta
MDMTVLIFDNGIYGLTKKQTSPTTPQEFPTNTHPTGAMLPPLNPLSVTLGVSNVSFVAQVVDWNAPLLYETIKTAHAHKGMSFVRIVQRCPVYVESISKDIQDDPGKLLLLNHENGIPIPGGVERLFENHKEHDPSDLAGARALVEDTTHIPVGLLYLNPDAQRYDEMTRIGMEMTEKERLDGLNQALDKFAM